MNDLLNQIAEARHHFINAASGLTPGQSQFKSAHEVWSVAEIVEHMVWAEMGGINGIWKTFAAIKANKPIWQGEAIHHGLSIEEIIDKTWKPKEQVPEVARPRWGGPVEYWIEGLKGCQPLLEALARQVRGYDLEKIIYPHIISGRLNVVQRMQFLRFHLNRHQQQIENIKMHAGYPGGSPEKG